jgi:HK97 family phage major capsid protein
MEDANELKRKRLSLLNRARQLVDTAETDGELSRDARREYDHLIEQADALEVRIDTIEAGWRDHSKSDIQARLGRYASRGPLTGPMRAEGRYNDNMSNENGFSIVKAIRAMVNQDWRGAEAEREASDRAAKDLGRESRGGVIIPERAWAPGRAEQRDLLKGTASAGGYTVGTEVLGASFVDRLTAASVMLSAGVTVLDNLQGDVSIPRLASGPTAYWVGENAAPTEGSQTWEQIALSPKSVAAYIDISRRLILQASLDVEAMVRNDIVRSLALAIDAAIPLGAGTNEPTGIVNTSGVTDKSGANGEAITWAELLDLEKGVAVANAATGKLAYVTNATIQASLKGTLKVSGDAGAGFLWDGGPRPVNDYPAYITNQIPANLAKGGGSNLSYVLFGNWADVILARWSGIDVLVDPYSGGTAGTVRVIAFADVDVAVRHPASICFGYYS